MNTVGQKEYLKVISRAFGINHNIQTLVSIAGRPFLRLLYFISYTYAVALFDEEYEKQASRKKKIKYQVKNYKRTIELAHDKLSHKDLRRMIMNSDFQEQINILLKKYLEARLTDHESSAAEKLENIILIRFYLLLFKETYSLHFPDSHPETSFYDKMIGVVESYITYLRRKEKFSLAEYERIYTHLSNSSIKWILRYNKEIQKTIPHIIYTPKEKKPPYRASNPQYEEMKRELKTAFTSAISDKNIIDAIKKLWSINHIAMQEFYDIIIELNLDWILYCPNCEKEIDIFHVDMSYRINEVLSIIKPEQEKPFLNALAGFVREFILFAIHSDDSFLHGWRLRQINHFIKEIELLSFRLGEQNFLSASELEYLNNEIRALSRRSLPSKNLPLSDFESLFYEPHIVPRLIGYLQTQEGGYFVNKNGQWIKSAAELIGFSMSLEINSYIHNGVKKADLCQLFSDKFHFPVKPVTWRKKINYKRDDAVEEFNQILKDFKLKLKTQNN